MTRSDQPAVNGIKRKDVQKLAHQLVDGIDKMRSDMARQDATMQRQAAEIELLRNALAIACGMLSTYEDHSMYHPDALVQQFLKEARRG